MQTIKDVTQLFVAWADVNTAGVEGDTIKTYADLNDGEVVVCDYKNVVLTSSDNLTTDLPVKKFKIVARAGTELHESPLVSMGQITGYYVTTQLADTQQIDTVGYNGTSGALDTTTNNLFTIRLYIQEQTIQGFMQQKVKEGFYKSSSTTTQQAIALGLCKSLVANYSREPEQDLKFERINSGAQLNAMASATASVVHGSKYVTLSEDESLTCPAGSVIRFGTSGAGVAPCYVVDSITASGLIITLDQEYQGATATIAHTAVETVTEGDWGILITGVARGFKTGYRTPNAIQFKTTIDFGDDATAEVATYQTRVEGQGTARKLANLELELQADEYVFRNFIEGAPTYRKQITDAAIAAGTLYDVITIDYYDYVDNGLGVEVKSPKTILIASGKASANAVLEDADSGVVVALDKMIVTNWVTPNTVAIQSLLT